MTVFVSRGVGLGTSHRIPSTSNSRNERRTNDRRATSVVIALALSCLCAPLARAGTGDASVFAQAGEGDRAVRSVAFGYAHDFWPVDADRPTPWSFFGEVIVGEWFNHRRAPGQRNSFAQFTVAPVVRYALSGEPHHFFVEGGIGVSWIAPHFQDDGRRFSTTFNFDDHVAIGYRFGRGAASEISIRVEHFSNGGVRHPNPGQNFGQLRFARHF